MLDIINFKTWAGARPWKLPL